MVWLQRKAGAQSWEAWDIRPTVTTGGLAGFLWVLSYLLGRPQS